ncbi:MAG: hypothetical protein ABIL02_05210 [candidate division WOR-3 bacterium]
MGIQKLILVIFLILTWIIPGNGLVIKTGQDVVIGVDEVIDDDLIAMARSIRIEGKVNGDLYAFAQEIKIGNIVNGSIYTGGAELEINAKDCRSLVAFCGSLKTNSKIANNLLFFGKKLATEKENIVKKDLIAFGNKIWIDGEVGDEIKGGMGKFYLNGKIGSADIQADSVNIDSGATVMGNMVIRSGKEPVIDSNAKILGKTEFKKIEAKIKEGRRGVGIFEIFKIIFFISKIVIGIILIALFKPYIKKTNEILKSSTWKSLGFGFLTIIIIPVVTVITLATIIGIPVAIFGVFVFLTLAYISGIIFATGLGDWIIRLVKKDGMVSPYLAFIIGFVIFTLVCLIPYLGFFIRLVVIFLGTGMIVLLLNKIRQDLKIRMEER